MRKQFILLFCFFSLLCSVVYAQSPSKIHFFNANKKIDLSQKSLSEDQFIQSNKEQLGLTAHDTLRKLNSITLRTHTVSRYQQFYKGIPVYGTSYNIHHNEGGLIKATGALYPLIDIEPQKYKPIKLPEFHIYDQIVTSFENYEYPFIPAYDNLDFKNKGLVIIDKAFPDFSGHYSLCRHVNVTNREESESINEDLFIELSTGKLITHFSHVHFHNVKGTGKTKYYGVQDITIDSVGPQEYLLQDFSRGQGIRTVNAAGTVFRNDSKHWDLTNENQNEIALDAHYSTAAFYDMMNERYGWSGIDGIGGELVSRVHVNGKYYVNAYWDGNRANFGNGDCDRYSPLTTLAIVGHEFMHGVTDYTSDLVYRNESGALNESMSDIFGKALEYYEDPQNFNWILGDIIRKDEDVNFIRSMDDPNLRNDPKYYGGEFWYEGTGDNGGVHSNSGVLNYWFYLLVEGGQGETENFQSFDVSPIGMDKAIDICFQMQAAYLTTGSDYFDAMYYSLESCQDLFGYKSDEYYQVLEAWKAVGLFPGYDTFDVSIEGEIPFIVLCPEEVHYPSCIIRNQGREQIPAGEWLSFTFSQVSTSSTFEENYQLEQGLQPGDSIVYTFSEPIINDESQNGNYHFHVSMVGESNELNNLYRGQFRTSSIDGMDIFLETVEFTYNQPCIADRYDRFRYRIRNLGCQVIEEGDTISFLVDTENGSFEVKRRMFFPMEPGDLQSSSIGVGNIDMPEAFSDYSVQILVEDDIDKSNDIASNTTYKRTQISNGYVERFDNGISEADYSIRGSDYYNTYEILNLDHNNMLGFWGLRDHSFFRDCDFDQDFFDQYNFKNVLSYCVNASEMAEPVFEFNLMQFLNESGIAEPFNPHFKSMVEVEIQDTSYLFYGQGESHFINRKVHLPEAYVGQLDINILTLGQNEITEDLGPTELKDMVLLDDIRLHSANSRNAIFGDTGYTIYPNPATDLIRVAHKSNTQSFDIRIYDLTGRIVKSKKNIINQHWFDISDLIDGVYLIEFKDESPKPISHKLIKLRSN